MALDDLGGGPRRRLRTRRVAGGEPRGGQHLELGEAELERSAAAGELERGQSVDGSGRS